MRSASCSHGSLLSSTGSLDCLDGDGAKNGDGASGSLNQKDVTWDGLWGRVGVACDAAFGFGTLSRGANMAASPLQEHSPKGRLNRKRRLGSAFRSHA